MHYNEHIIKPFMVLPDYPLKPEPAPRAHGDPNATCDPLSYLLRCQYEALPPFVKKDEVILIDTPAAFFAISNAHARFPYPVAAGQKQDEKWYCIKNTMGSHRLYIAMKREAYKVYSSCHVEVYDEGFNLLGRAGEVIPIRDDRNYFIRTYGIGPYDLYVARETKESLRFEGAIFTEDAMRQNGHQKLLGYDHNTVTYLNKDGTRTVYVSSVPVETCKLDLRKEGDCYQSNSDHVSVTLPEHLHEKNAIRLDDFMELYPMTEGKRTGKQVDRANAFGAKLPCIRYDHFFRENLPLYCYATSFGVNMEIVIPEYTGEHVFSLRMKQPTDLYSEVEPDYIAFQDETDLRSMIYTPMAVDAAGKWNDQNRLDLSAKNADGVVEVYFTVDKDFLEDPDTKYPVTLNQSFYLYRHKQPDTSIYSVSDMYARYYLSPYLMLGKQTPRGEGWALLRFEVLENLPVDSEEVIRAEYCFTNLVERKDNAIVGVYAITTDWCSVNTRWRSKPNYDQLPVKTMKVRGQGAYGIEVTELLKEILQNRGTYEPRHSVRNSFLIKSNTRNSSLLLAAGDAGFFPPYLKIILKHKELKGEF